MPKMKTKKSVAKRFSMTASGKLKIKKSGLRHILTKKSTSTKRHARKGGYAATSDVSRIKACIPYA